MFILYFKAIILAIVQGVTEVLPISSSAHLAVLHKILDFQLEDNLLFDIALHVGTALALAFLFLPKLKNLWQDKALWLKIILGIIPAALIGFLIEDYVDKFGKNLLIIGIALIFGALLFLLVEKYTQARYDDLSKIKKSDALIIGCLQILSFIPGISRSGITIIAGMSRALSRRLAAEFSFLLAIPLILGMGLKKIWNFWQGDLLLKNSDIYLFVVSALIAGVIAYFFAKYLLKFLEKYGLQIFAWYRIILGGLIILLNFL